MCSVRILNLDRVRPKSWQFLVLDTLESAYCTIATKEDEQQQTNSCGFNTNIVTLTRALYHEKYNKLIKDA